MWTFGAGVLIGTPTQDARGNAIAATARSPIQFGILQEVTVDTEWEDKSLYGANQFPVDVGRGKGKMSLKAKAAQINAELYNTFIWGQTLATGYAAIYNDLSGTLVPATAGTTAGGTATFITVSPTAAGGGASAVFSSDLGVTDTAGIPYTRVAAAPTAGQYSVSSTGIYQFSNIQGGSTVFINYAYTNAGQPTAARNITAVNLPMGYAPFFQVNLMTQKNGNTDYIIFPQVMASKLSRTFKNDDFTIPEFEMQAFADSTGNICSEYLSQ